MDNPSFDEQSRNVEKPQIQESDVVIVAMSDVEASNSGQGVKNVSTPKKLDLIYYVDDYPPWYLWIFLGFQHYLTMFGATIALPLILAPALCMTDTVHISEFTSTHFFVSGLITIVQITIGIRLPIVQGGTFAFLTPVFAILSLPEWQCPAPVDGGIVVNSTLVHATDNMTFVNATDNMTTASTMPTEGGDGSEVWKLRIREIQGAIILASLLQVVIGMSGIIGLLLRFIGPIVIAPTIALIGLSLFRSASGFCSSNWPIAIMTMVLIIFFSQYMRNVNIPYCGYSKEKGCGCKGFPMFKLFPIILGILTSWLVCYILTITDTLENDVSHWTYKARTDIKSDVIKQAKWFRFPYPGQWGLPTFSAAGVFGMMSGVLAGMIESIGDYYACARLSGAPPPPVHAINRGILIEGLGCIIAGLWGTGTGTTSYSENIGAIGLTKVSSRIVVLCGAVLMLLLGMLGKFGALFVTIPDPIIGGVFMVMFGMITAVGISNLQFVDMNSSRNLFIFGFSLFFGLSLTDWMQVPENAKIINTGDATGDQIIVVLLSTSMFVGGTVAFILDNTVPGTDEERGMTIWKQQIGSADDDGNNSAKEDMKIYNLPLVMPFIKRQRWTKYIPFCPTFNGCGLGQQSTCCCTCCKKNNQNQEKKDDDGNNNRKYIPYCTEDNLHHSNSKDSNLHHRGRVGSSNSADDVITDL